MAMAQAQADPFSFLCNDSARAKRVQTYRVWGLQRKLSDISSQTEAAVLEARNLLSWKCRQQPRPPTSDLSEHDKRSLESSRRNRLADIVLRACAPLLKLVISHKWSFPFNTPVDTSKYPDYLNVVTTPMDLSTMRVRMDSNNYRDPKDFWVDLNLVFDNAKKYNPAGSDCFLMAQTLQEVAMERYEKTVAPRVAEEERALLHEELAMQRRRAAAEDAADSAAVEQQCGKLLALVDELQGGVLDLRSEAASLCELVGPEEKAALLASMQALPTAQLEAAVAFVASRHPLVLQQQQGSAAAGAAAQDAAAAAASAPATKPPKVQLVLGRLDTVLLRQLKHLTACAAAMPPSATVEDEGKQQATAGSSPMQVDAAEPSSDNANPVMLAEDPARATEVAAPSIAVASPALSANQRVLADTVTNPASVSVSGAVGVAWPGLPLGSGIRARPSAHIDTGADAAAAAVAAAAAAATAAAAARRASLAAAASAKAQGVKRKAPSPIMVEFTGGEPAAAAAPSTAPAAAASTVEAPTAAADSAPGSASAPAAPPPSGTLVSPKARAPSASKKGAMGGAGIKASRVLSPKGGPGEKKRSLASLSAAVSPRGGLPAASPKLGGSAAPSQQRNGGGTAALAAAVAAAAAKGGSSLPSPGSLMAQQQQQSPAAAALAAALNQMAGRVAAGGSLMSPSALAASGSQQQQQQQGKLSAQQAAAVTAAFGHLPLHQALQAAAAAAAAKGHPFPFAGFGGGAGGGGAPAAPGSGQQFLDLAKGMSQLGNLPASLFAAQAQAHAQATSNMMAAAAAAQQQQQQQQQQQRAMGGGTPPNMAAAAAAAVAAAAAAGLDSSSPHHQQQLQVLQAAHLLQQHAIQQQQQQQQQQVAAAVAQQQRHMVLDLGASRQAAAAAAVAAATAAAAAAVNVTLPVQKPAKRSKEATEP